MDTSKDFVIRIRRKRKNWTKFSVQLRTRCGTHLCDDGDPRDNESGEKDKLKFHCRFFCCLGKLNLRDLSAWCGTEMWIERMSNGDDDDLKYRLSLFYVGHIGKNPLRWCTTTPQEEIEFRTSLLNRPVVVDSVSVGSYGLCVCASIVWMYLTARCVGVSCTCGLDVCGWKWTECVWTWFVCTGMRTESVWTVYAWIVVPWLVFQSRVAVVFESRVIGSVCLDRLSVRIVQWWMISSVCVWNGRDVCAVKLKSFRSNLRGLGVRGSSVRGLNVYELMCSNCESSDRRKLNSYVFVCRFTMQERREGDVARQGSVWRLLVLSLWELQFWSANIPNSDGVVVCLVTDRKLNSTVRKSSLELNFWS